MNLFRIGLIVLLAASGAWCQKLDGRVAYRLKGLERSLDSADAALKAGKTAQAKTSLESARRQWKQINEYYPGKVDPSHPRIAKVKARLDQLAGSARSEAAASAATDANLAPLLETMKAQEKTVAAALKEARYKVMGFTSKIADFNQYRKLSVFDAPFAAAATLVETMDAVLPPATAAAAAFRAQHPDPALLKRRSPRGWEALQTAELLDQHAQNWRRIKSSTANELLQNAEGTLQMSVTQLGHAAKMKPHVRKALANSARSSALAPTQVYVRFVRMLYAGTPEANDASAVLARTATVEKKVADLSQTIAKTLGDAENERKVRLANARFPALDKGDAKLHALIEKSYAAFAPDRTILKVGVHAPFETRTEARWRQNRWDIGTFKYLGATVCSKTKKGTCRVHRLTLRQRRAPDGTFGPLKVFGVGSSYEILEENVPTGDRAAAN